MLFELLGCGFLIPAVWYLSSEKYDVSATIHKVFLNCNLLFKRDKKLIIPKLNKVNKTKSGYYLLYRVPPGMTLKDLVNYKNEFAEALNADIEIERRGKCIGINVMKEDLPAKVKFHFPDNWDKETKGMSLPVLLGMSHDGYEIEDLSEFPHLLVGGETYGGKSNLIHQIVQCLLKNNNVEMKIIDMAKLDFYPYEAKGVEFAHTQGKALSMLRNLRKELDRRIEKLSRYGCRKIQEYKGEDMPFNVLIIDEMTQLSPVLAKDKDDKKVRVQCHSYMTDLLCLARKVGIHVIIGTQRPDKDILPGQLKANIPATVAFRVRNEINSKILLDNDRAAYLPRIRGRGMFQFKNERLIQAMLVPNEHIKATEKTTEQTTEQMPECENYEETSPILEEIRPF